MTDFNFDFDGEDAATTYVESVAWIPQEGDVLQGTVVRIGEYTNDNQTYPIYTVDDGTDLQKSVHALHKVLREELEKNQVGVGDVIGIKFYGKRQPKEDSGRPFYFYKVKVADQA